MCGVLISVHSKNKLYTSLHVIKVFYINLVPPFPLLRKPALLRIPFENEYYKTPPEYNKVNCHRNIRILTPLFAVV